MTLVPEATQEEMAAAAESAATAFKTWRHTPVSVRQRVFFRLQELIHKNEMRIVDAIVRENGKTVTDAKGDVFRGLEVVEYASSVSSQLMGETLEGVSKNVDSYSFRQPIGVAAGVCPFNFPAARPQLAPIRAGTLFPLPRPAPAGQRPAGRRRIYQTRCSRLMAHSFSFSFFPFRLLCVCSLRAALPSLAVSG